MVAFEHYGVGSPAIFAGSVLWGFGFLYLYSRRGANHLLDFSTLRTCYASSAAAFMVGTSLGMTSRVGNARNAGGGRDAICLNRRVAQNERMHSVLRTMKFHLSTR